MIRIISSAILILGLFISSCTRSNNGNRKAGLRSLDGGMRYAEHLELEITDSCTIIKILNPWQGASNIIQSYYLVDRYNPQALSVDKAYIIPVPVKKIICMSSTHLAMISALKEERSISALSGTDYVYNPTVRQRIDSGLVGETGYDAGINTELILRMDPDIIMMYGIGSESAGYAGKVAELGIKVMYNADYLESDPLGKAEWIKLFGALYCREKMADSIFRAIESEYYQVSQAIRNASMERPDVLLGMPFRDTWFVSPGNSYVSKLIEDAGGRYLWKDSRSEFSMPLGFEEVYLESVNADFWLNPGSADSKSEIAAIDPRLKELPCFRSGKIYNNNKRVTPKGGNDYWESGSINPQIILKDIGSILHPGIFGDYEMFYYKKVGN